MNHAVLNIRISLLDPLVDAGGNAVGLGQGQAAVGIDCHIEVDLRPEETGLDPVDALHTG